MPNKMDLLTPINSRCQPDAAFRAITGECYRSALGPGGRRNRPLPPKRLSCPSLDETSRDQGTAILRSHPQRNWQKRWQLQLASAIYILSAMTAGLHANAQTVRPIPSVVSFLSTLGVNTHTGTWDASYGLPDGSGGDAAKIYAELVYSGIFKIRDTVEFSWQIPEYATLANLGIEFDFFIGAGNGAGSLRTQISYIASLSAQVSSVEGPNESDNWPVTFHKITGLPATPLMQETLYGVVKADKRLSDKPVLESSLGNSSSYAALAGLGCATFGNTHSYFFGFDEPISSQIPAKTAQESIVAPNLITATTETGWSTLLGPANPYAVNDDVQAKLMLTMIFDQFNSGSVSTYIYQLMDEPGLDDYYGIFEPDGTPKPAALALHNLNTILAKNAKAVIKRPSALPYTVSSLPVTARSTFLQKNASTFDLVLWNEDSIWNPLTKTETPVAVVPATVTLQINAASIMVYDPMLGTNALLTATNVPAIQIEVPDHPVVVELTLGG